MAASPHTLDSDIALESIHISNVTGLTSKSDVAFCVPGPPGSSRHGRETRHPVTYPQDCLTAGYEIIQGGRPSAPQAWTASRSWVYDSCAISLDLVARGPDTFSQTDVAEAASKVLTKCVTRAQGYLGGWIIVGDLQFSVGVTGTTRPGSGDG